MERKVIPEAEAKLTILYSLQHIGPVSNLQLVQFMAETELMDYFTLQICLGELEEEGQLKTQVHTFGCLISLTETGLEALRSFDRRVPASRRQIIVEQGAAWRERFRAEQQTPASFFVAGDGKLCMHLQLMEQETVLLDILVTEQDAVPPTFLAERWRHAAPGVYQCLAEELGSEADSAIDTLPEHVLCQQSKTGEWLLNLGDLNEGDELAVLMTLPDRAMALSYASLWAQKKALLRNRILEQLRDDLDK